MASTTDCTVVAVFDSADDARAAAAELKSAGFGSDKVFISSEGSGSGDYSTGTSSTTTQHEGGITGWFKSLFGSGEHEHRSTYESAVAGGKTIVSVDAPEESADQVSDILNRYSPVNLHTEDYGEAHGVATSNTYDSGYQGSKSDLLNARDELRGAAATTTGSAGVPVTGQTGANTSTTAGTVGTSNTRSDVTGTSGTAGRQTIPVVEEELQVGKRAVQRGGVRIYSRTSDRPVEENVQLREEHVEVNRQPVNRPASEADFRAGREQVIEVAEYAEEPVVAKQARVVEEVSVNKEASERTETIRDTVRRTDVQVENLSGSNAQAGTAGQTSYDDDFRKDFSSRYASTGGTYDDYAPGYRYGSEIANDPRYKGQDYSTIESQLRDDYTRRNPNSSWERVKDSVRYGWDKVTGKARSTTSSR